MQLIRCLLGCVLVLVSVGVHADEAIKIATPRGAAIEVIAEKPSGRGPFPAVVLAAGAGYHMRLPIMQQAAEALLAQGIAVYRFDWAYRVAGTAYAAQPRDRSAEIEDMRTVVALARRDTEIDGSRMAVGGKSLGSIVAWQVLRATPELRGGILLTPVCSQPNAGDAATANYPGMSTEQRPRLWVLGDSDALCPVQVFHRFIAAGGQADRIAVISGNHGFEMPDHRERDQQTLDLALHLMTDFASTLLATMPGKP